jgi:hypothetical protein
LQRGVVGGLVFGSAVCCIAPGVDVAVFGVVFACFIEEDAIGAQPGFVISQVTGRLLLPARILRHLPQQVPDLDTVKQPRLIGRVGVIPEALRFGELAGDLVAFKIPVACCGFSEFEQGGLQSAGGGGQLRIATS